MNLQFVGSGRKPEVGELGETFSVYDEFFDEDRRGKGIGRDNARINHYSAFFRRKPERSVFPAPPGVAGIERTFIGFHSIGSTKKSGMKLLDFARVEVSDFVSRNTKEAAR